MPGFAQFAADELGDEFLEALVHVVPTSRDRCGQEGDGENLMDEPSFAKASAGRCRILKSRRRWLLQIPCPQHPLHFVVVGQREDVKTFGPILKEIPQFDSGAALEGFGAKFPNAQTGMLMRAAKRLSEVVQCQQTFCTFRAR